jgi:hypothetical protein
VPTVNRPLCHTRRLLLALTLATACLLCTGATIANATAEAEIEGVWFFNGGQIAVKPLTKGAYVGIVVSATAFADCTHDAGEQIWSEIKEQRGGYYSGLHQWFKADCKPNPILGPTAWRVLREADGARYMRVCFSHPGTSQPRIDANGDPKNASEYFSHGVTYGCYDSALLAALPVVAGAGGPSGTVEGLSLPSAHQCLVPARKRFTIRLKDPRYDPFKTVTITFKGHRVKVVRHGGYIVATLNVSHLRSHSFTINVKATTVLGHKLSARRTYRLCAKKHKRGKHGKKG